MVDSKENKINRWIGGRSVCPLYERTNQMSYHVDSRGPRLSVNPCSHFPTATLDFATFFAHTLQGESAKELAKK